MQKVEIELGFDPTASLHTYKLAFILRNDDPLQVSSLLIINCMVNIQWFFKIWILKMQILQIYLSFKGTGGEGSRLLLWSRVVRRPSVRLLTFFNFFSKTAWSIFIKLGRDEVFMVPYKFCCFSVRSAHGWIKVGAIIGHGGPLLQNQKTRRLQEQTECIVMI